MFKVKKIDSLLWPVEIDVPREDGSAQTDTHLVKIKYRYLSTDDYEQATKEVLAKDSDKDFRDFVLDWEDVFDAEGNQLPFSRKALNDIMSERWIAAAINYGFRDCQDAGLRKN
jgi:hypothetical protein